MNLDAGYSRILRMKKDYPLRKTITRLTILMLSSVLSILPFCSPKKYGKLLKFIEATRFIDVHSHPVAGHVEYKARDPYPTLEPPIGRPFWPLGKERIAVFDFMLPAALQDIYGYSQNDVTDEDMPELSNLSQKFWAAGKKNGFNRVLDICGIEKTFANTGFPNEELDRDRVFWVPFVDYLLYPFEGSHLRSTNPELKRNLDYYSQAVRKSSEDLGVEIKGLSSYLLFVDKVLNDYKKKGAVALKVAGGYIRTLWFDDPEKDEVSTLFESGKRSELFSLKSYKRIQDYIARHIFRRAGELKLPVHFHTGFGASAGLKNLDSNPLNLESVFSDIRFTETQILMLHAGYPSWDKLKPLLEKRNVYAEFSAVNWFVFEEELEKILYEWLEYPGASEKIMFGSDAGAPVFFWIAARNSREALFKALAQLINKGIIDEDKAILLAGKIMRDNALRLHGLE